MKVDLPFLDRIGVRVGRESFAETFPDGVDFAGEPDPVVIDKFYRAEFYVGLLCARVLTQDAWLSYNTSVKAARSVRDTVIESANAHLDSVSRAAVHKHAVDEGFTSDHVSGMIRYASLGRDASGWAAWTVFRAVRGSSAWRLLADPDNIRPEYRS